MVGSPAYRWLGAASVVLALAGAASSCGDDGSGMKPEPLFDPEVLDEDFVEVVSCRHSHEHELLHVRVVADPEAAEMFERCVLSGLGDRCGEDGFPPGSLFVKYEYDSDDCSENFMSYTASLRLEDGSYPDGLDWHWQRVSPELDVLQDGAPDRCILCHVDHCASPDGFDLRCLPD